MAMTYGPFEKWVQVKELYPNSIACVWNADLQEWQSFGDHADIIAKQLDLPLKIEGPDKRHTVQFSHGMKARVQSLLPATLWIEPPTHETDGSVNKTRLSE